jgi:hypothetical protein
MSRSPFALAVLALTAAVSFAPSARAQTAPPPQPSGGTPTTPPSEPPAASTAPAAPPAPSAASAERDKAKAEDEKDDDHTVYASISPFHLIFPVVEGTAEIKLHRKIGVAGIFGAGSMKMGGYKFKVWEVGGQFVGYPVGHFDNGMQLGVEMLYASVSTSDQIDKNTTISGVGSGLSIGPMIGYKLATKIGFSFNIQGGAALVVARAEVSDSAGGGAKAEQSTVVPILNINVGWSF